MSGHLRDRLLIFNRFHDFWSTGYQRGSLEIIVQNGDYLKQALQKSCPSTGFEPAVFESPYFWLLYYFMTLFFYVTWFKYSRRYISSSLAFHADSV